MCLCLVDLDKAFDTVPRDQLINVLHEKGLDAHMIEAIRHLYINTIGQVAGDT